MQNNSEASTAGAGDSIVLNGVPRLLGGASSVADLIDVLALRPERVAVEVNEVLVRRAEYAQTRLNPGDRVEIVTLVGGG
jgi:thiamine biosynthesis protein ThiS